MKQKLSKKQLLREAQQQTDALKQLKRWMQWAMIVSSCAVALA